MRQNDRLAGILVRRLRAADLPVRLVGNFVEATHGTIGDWLSETQLPMGYRLSRLQHLLDLLGIESPELDEDVSPFGQYLGRLLAFGVLTPVDASTILGKVYDQAVRDTVMGIRDPLSSAVDKKPTKTLEELKEEHDEALAEKEEFWRQKFAEEGYTGPESEPESLKTTSPGTQFTPPPDGSDRGLFLVSAARSFSDLLPLARYLVSDSCTSAERWEFRELLGEDGMFELSTRFNQLCGQRAHETGW